MKGTAALYEGIEKGFSIVELPTPEVEPGGILVRVTAAAICGSDLHYWRGDFKIPEERLPRIMGHEFCGYVHTLGKGVTTDSLRQLRILSMQHYDPWVIPAALDFLVRTRERYALTQVVSHTYPLGRINEAFELADWSTREGGTPVTRAIVIP